MRDIKFRARVKTTYNEGCTFESVIYSWVYYHPSDGLPELEKNQAYIYGQIEIEYTGLNDKNGKEIYEGDIVSDHVGNGIVKYSCSNAAFRVSYGNGMAKWFYDYTLSGEKESIEVIGNIHENPELLEATP